MSIIITGPISSQAIESLGRRRVIQFGQLDQMQCIFFGPDISFNDFPINSPHPQYPLMLVTGVQGTYIPGALNEIQVNYEGKFVTSGKESYITDPILSTTPSQGSRDFEVLYVQQMSFAQYATNATQLATPQGPYQYGPLYVYGTQKVSVRYIGDSVSIKYFIWPSVILDSPNFLGLGLSRVGWHILSEQFGEVTVTGSWNGPGFNPSMVMKGIPNSSPPLQAAFMGMSVTPIGPKWFEVTENYGATF